MERFHVHIQVESLEKSLDFYSAMFGAEPTRRESSSVPAHHWPSC